jgi:predicted  nucleic acid-binding Zn-ribbon protein
MPETALTPAEQIAKEISALQSDISSLQSGVQLSSLRNDLDKIESKTAGLTERIIAVRTRGYLFERNLEAESADIPGRWSTLNATVQAQINAQTSVLQGLMRSIEAQMTRLSALVSNPSAAQPLINQLKTDIDNLESKVSATEQTIRGMFDDFSNEVNKINTHLEQLEWMLTQVDEGCFKLMPVEAAIMAVKAVWAKDGKDSKTNPEGVLYLTDQRLIFEQKQEVATKKFLFITTETQKIQACLFEIPVPMIEKIEASKQGFFKNEDWMDLLFATGAQLREAKLHLYDQDSAVWQGYLNKAVAKEFDKERVAPVNSEVVEKIKNAPTICPSCGGSISKPVLRGMDSITCEFCGKVIRF